MTMNRYKFLLFTSLFTFVFCLTTAKAQQIQAKVSTVENGYSSILIPQEFRARIANNLSTLRLKDAKGNEVPFVVKPQEADLSFFSPIPYEHIKNTVDSTEVFLIDQKDKKKSSGYIIQVANSDNNKKYLIEGSDDMQNWFGIVNNGILTSLKDDTQTFTSKSINFPPVDYRYIRIMLDNKRSSPIRVLNIGEIKNSGTTLKLEKIKDISYKQTNNPEHKTTTIAITKDLWTPIDYFVVYASSPKQYYRTAYTYVEQQKASAVKNNNSKQKHSISEYLQLHSNAGETYPLQDSYPSLFFMEIENKDNPPLKIDSILFYQTPIHLIADLDKKQIYNLQVDSIWSAPNYDLSKIDLNLPADIPVAKVSDIQINKTDSTLEDKDYGNWILIGCSILGIFLVFYFGKGLIKDLNKEK